MHHLICWGRALHLRKKHCTMQIKLNWKKKKLSKHLTLIIKNNNRPPTKKERACQSNSDRCNSTWIITSQVARIVGRAHWITLFILRAICHKNFVSPTDPASRPTNLCLKRLWINNQHPSIIVQQALLHHRWQLAWKLKGVRKWRVLNADNRNLAAMPLKSSLIPAQGVQKKDYIVTSSPITKEPIKEHV